MPKQPPKTPRRRETKTYRVNIRLEPELGAELEQLARERSVGAYGPTTLAAALVREALLAIKRSR